MVVSLSERLVETTECSFTDVQSKQASLKVRHLMNDVHESCRLHWLVTPACSAHTLEQRHQNHAIE